MDSETVLGHYVANATGQWAPALQQSTELFNAIVNDDISRFEEESKALGSGSLGAFTILYWSEGRAEQASPQVQAKARNLLSLAVYHGALRVISYLLSKGANPRTGQDGQSAYEFIEETNPNAPTIRAMLDDAAGNFAVIGGDSAGSVQQIGSPDGQGNPLQPQQITLQQEIDQSHFESLPYSTADLTRPEYSTDTFRMYCFKVLRCSKRYAHDWRACPFAHPTENARRRDPREFKYSSLVCPDYRQGCCVRGDTCQYAHGVFESWLHPSRYRTQLCKDQEKCDRPVCFFAHNVEELRTPVDSFVPHPEERLRVPEAMQVVLGIATPTGLSAGGADTSCPTDQNTTAVSDHQLIPSRPQHASSGNLAGSSSGGGLAAASGSSSSIGGLAEAGSYGVDQGTGNSAVGKGSSSPTKQLVSPSAVPLPRMSNAFARKHGLDPKENPLVNLQRLAFQQQVQPQQAASTGRRNRRGARTSQQTPSPQPLLQQMPLHSHATHYMQQPPPSPAAAAYYGAAPMQVGHMQPAPATPAALFQDPQTMALLFSGMSLGGAPLGGPAAAAVAAAAMAGQPMQQQLMQPMGYQLAAPVPHLAIPPGMLAGSALTPTGLGPQSPLQPSVLTPTGAGLPSPHPPPY